MAATFDGWGPGGEEMWVKMADGCEVFVRKWAPEAGGNRGIVHLCHGMAEHSARYGDLDSLLAKEGFVVYAADHRAHGKTAERASAEGSKTHWLGHHDGVDAITKIVEDHEQLVAQEIQDPGNKGLPFFVFGHSMGSVIATLLSAKASVASCIKGLVLSGCPARLPAALAAAFGPLLSILRTIHGGSGVAPLISKLSFDKWNAKFAPNATTDDWLNRDPVEVKKYIDDPLCGFKCSVDFMGSMMGAMKTVASKDVLQNIPKTLPVVVMVGSDDPCTMTDLGKRSSQQVVEEFAAANLAPPKVVLYGGARHEIAKELCREDVANDILTFLNVRVRQVSGVPHSRL